MTVTEVIFHFIFAILATAGFSILFNAPKKVVLPTALAGAVGWMVNIFYVNYATADFNKDFIGAFLAAFVINTLCQLLARYYKMPIIVFSIPGVITLVPGGAAYNMMRALTLGNMPEAMTYARNTLYTAAAIAVGIAFSTVVFQAIHPRIKLRKPRKIKTNTEWYDDAEENA